VIVVRFPVNALGSPENRMEFTGNVKQKLNAIYAAFS
jgi:hypothetical protein